MIECHLLEKCGFYALYASSGLIDTEKLLSYYCRGTHKHECKRLQYLYKYGVVPSDHMLPDGSMINLEVEH